MQQTISADAQSFLEFHDANRVVKFKRQGRRYEVLGRTASVAIVLEAAAVVDAWLAADQGLQRKHAAALKAGERKLSAVLARGLKRFDRHVAKATA